MAVDRIKSGRIDIEWVKRSQDSTFHSLSLDGEDDIERCVCLGPVPTIFQVDVVVLVFEATDGEVAIR